MSVREDRRVLRTRELLRGALFSLIREKGFEALSVQEIIDRANVGRATFYAHFDNKEDLLLSGFETLRTSLKQRQREAQVRAGLEDRVFAFSHDLFVHVNGHRDLFRAMVGKHSGAVVQSVVHKLLLELVRDDIKALLPRAASKSVPDEILTEFIAGGIFGLLIWWMKGRMRPTVDELDEMFKQLAFPVLKANLA